MTWTKLGDEFLDDASDLSHHAWRLHVEALLWSNRRLLDLAIPKTALRRFANLDPDDTPLAVAELLDHGWWEERGPVYWIGCRYPDWQQDKAQVEHRRGQWSETKRRARLHRIGDHSRCLAKNCPHARTSSEDSPAEATEESPHDPVSVSVSVSGLEGRDHLNGYEWTHEPYAETP